MIDALMRYHPGGLNGLQFAVVESPCLHCLKSTMIVRGWTPVHQKEIILVSEEVSESDDF